MLHIFGAIVDMRDISYTLFNTQNIVKIIGIKLIV